MFDITTQAVAETGAVHLKGLDGSPLYFDGKPVRIVVYGPSSTAFAELEDRQSNRAMKRLNENDGKPSVPPLEERRAEVAEDLAAITVAFDNLMYPPAGDKQGKELFRAFYADDSLGHVAMQVQKFVRGWGNFKRVSPTA